MRLEPEVEGQLARSRRLQLLQQGPERSALLQRRVKLAERREIGEAEPRVRIVPERGLDDAPLLEVPQVVLAQERVHREHVLLPVELCALVLQIRQARRPAKLGLGDDADAAGLFGIQLHRAANPLGVCRGIAGERMLVGHTSRVGLGADDEECRARCDFVVTRAAEPADRRARILAADRPQASREHERLALERKIGRNVERQLRHE